MSNANGSEDVYSWLLASADQLPYPGLEPNPLDADSIGVRLDTDDHSLLSRQPPITLEDSHSIPSLSSNHHNNSNNNYNDHNNSTSNNNSSSSSSQYNTSSSSSRNNNSNSTSTTTTNNNNNNNYNGQKSSSNNTNSSTTGKKRASASDKKDEKQSKRAKQSREDVLERNRRSARECRERKKERVSQLEARVKRLEQENMQLRVQLRIGRETDESETAEKWRITNLLGDMIKEGKSDEVIEDTITMFTERYADYGKERRVACRYHLDYLEKLLVPTQVSYFFFILVYFPIDVTNQYSSFFHFVCLNYIFYFSDLFFLFLFPILCKVTKMGLWSLDQEDDFYEDGSSTSMDQAANNSIWHILCRELKVSEEQKQRIVSHRGKIRTLCGDLKSSLELLSSLRRKVDGKNEALEAEMKILQGFLTPKQAAQFILWVSHNPACMQMLNKLWAKMEEPQTSNNGMGGGSSSSTSSRESASPRMGGGSSTEQVSISA